ncbi:MAG: AAA family ATPase [Candidatus Omnitrophota bacterium]|nr:AAA family ATPase [Candidatus Omnitrophota bacterium]
MYFKRLELVGFKSFMDKTTLNFEPGVTAVVGPNGCGKSNIFDAIRWVLGEQSAKSLRGSDMQDVIFNGTDNYPALSMAEVSLTFSNEGRFFNIDHPEVMITRRLFRSGESEYLLNKSQARLKDIMDILLGTGVGAESYSIVAQGKIDLVLSSRPEERRIVFDEASGITKYKAQKRETMRRLEETEQNLLRINDIIQEVQRSIGHLERQANKARRYKELFEDLKVKEIKLSHLQKDKLLKSRLEICAELQKIKAQEQQIQAVIQEEENSLVSSKEELQGLEENISRIRNLILNLDNVILRNNQRIGLNEERVKELEDQKRYFSEQIIQVQKKIALGEEKITLFKQEQAEIKVMILEKTSLLQLKEGCLHNLILNIKDSLNMISSSKNRVMDLVSASAQAKNVVVDLQSREQVHLARKKRLDIEEAKVEGERLEVVDSLNVLAQEIFKIENNLGSLNLKIINLNDETERENISLEVINSQMDKLEAEKIALQSHREFLEKLKTQYEGIDTSMNAVIYLDKPLQENLSGLVVKIKEYLSLDDQDKLCLPLASLKLSAEAKPIDLDARKVSERITKIEQEIAALISFRQEKQLHVLDIENNIKGLDEQRKGEELKLANSKTIQKSTQEQLDKIKAEEEVVGLELQDVQEALTQLQQKIIQSQGSFNELDLELKTLEGLIHEEQEKISLNSHEKEEISVSIAKLKAELEPLNKRVNSDGAALMALEEALRQEEVSLTGLNNQVFEAKEKQESLKNQSNELSEENIKTQISMQDQAHCLKGAETRFNELSSGLNDILRGIQEKKKLLDTFKDKAYDMQMQLKDIDFKVQSVTERIQQAYKVELDNQPQAEEALDEALLQAESEKLKEKLDNYGTVNLVAIEEYDELKERYDFLTQQQNDLVTAKSSLQDAIQKINRTTRKMFLETFEKVKVEFKNYFRLLFNGGDAQLFLIDENDPLESGIEIICRPPGKKLQNVLLLSGGEKSMAAIALIFAIFKVKPAPFCILDEIDAALDEVNVDRFSRLFQEFTGVSQFIVITHNKRTIINANVMYGITMQKSGVSQIVSVKFSDHKEQKVDNRQEVAAV